MDGADEALAFAEEAAEVLRRMGFETRLIGATAMAVHGYTRATADIDIAVSAMSLDALRAVAAALAKLGRPTELREPDIDDPLGGLIRIEVDDMVDVDIINFGNPHTGAGRRLGELIVTDEGLPLVPTKLTAVSVSTLILLKLAAGSRFDLLDAAELLERHPELDRNELAAQCNELGLQPYLQRLLETVSPD